MILEEFGIELAPMSETELTYEEAKMYCFTLTYDGKIGWRLPRYEEYCTIPQLAGWHEQDLVIDDGWTRNVIPVRDLR